MKEQSGRSLIEIIGVLAIGTVMIVAAYRVYNNIDNRQKRMIASDTLEDVAKKTKLLYGMAESYPADLSVDKLFDDGALSNKQTPIGSGWTVSRDLSKIKFNIAVSGLSYDECEYFKLKKTDWATVSSNPSTCTKNKTHTVTFTVQ